MMETFKRYVLPGLVFQSVIVGGGYATGRELVEFFLPSGPIGGVIGLLVAGLVFGVVMAVAYEFARVTRSYDYRTFCKHLLGRFWVVYEVAYIALVILILAVVGSAAGELVAAHFNVSTMIGTIAMMGAVALLTFYGSNMIGKVMACWSVLLYGVYIILLVVTFVQMGDRIEDVMTSASAGEGWFSSGLRYAGYNINLPAVLFCIAMLRTRKETLGAGLITGAITIIPALLFYIAMMSQYPQIGEQPVPALYLMAQLNIGWLEVFFNIVVFGTFIETGAGILHAINERIDQHARERGRDLSPLARSGVAFALLLISIYGATAIGIVDLIGKGYGLLTYVFIAVLVVPLLTLGIWKIKQRS